jgi:uncharacterized surface protein with fasciclin (FAS1) repeats
MNTNKDVWIGVIALAIIAGVGTLWLVESYRISSMVVSTTTVPVAVTTATTTDATTTPAVQIPKPVNRASQSVVTIAEHITGATEFASLMATSGVAALIKGPGPFTIFVPTNGAFSQLPRGTISKLSPAAAKRLVEYHVVSGRAIDPSAEVSGSIQTLSGDMLNFSLGTDNIALVNSAILISAYTADNGIVYLIDNVLIPPSPTQQL